MTEIATCSDRRGSVPERNILCPMHTGRALTSRQYEAEAKIPVLSAIARLKMYVDGKGDLEIPQPTAMTIEDIATVTAEYVQAAKNAIAAGFDGRST
jgi:N-ethylmaleimide reductase